jgi:hypothetical protein
MVRSLLRRCMVSLCFVALLVAFGHAEEADQLLARANQAEQVCQLDAAAELYHRAATMWPEDFNLRYAAGLHCILEVISKPSVR